MRLEVMIIKMLKAICKQNDIGNSNNNYNKIVTLKFTVYSGDKVRILGQFLTNKQKEFFTFQGQ